jgi:hypothetical protein
MSIYNLQFLVSWLAENRMDLHIAAANQSLCWQVKPISVQCFMECGHEAAARTIDLPICTKFVKVQMFSDRVVISY